METNIDEVAERTLGNLPGAMNKSQHGARAMCPLY